MPSGCVPFGRAPWILAPWILALAVAAAVPGQFNPWQPSGQTPTGQNPSQGGQGQDPNWGIVDWSQRNPYSQQQLQQPQQQQGFGANLQGPGLQGNAPSGFPGVEWMMPSFRGFPVPQTGRPGFGGYPGFTPPAKLPDDFMPPAGSLRPPGLWPSWLAPGRPDAESTARSDQVILVRSSERVWYRPADESVFVPLPFFDKVRAMQAGAGVQVRTKNGLFMLLCHDGATWRSLGQAVLELRSLSDAVVEFDILDLHRIWVLSKTRRMRVRLPDTSTLETAGSHIYLAREGERVIVRNYGPAPARLASPLGTVDLASNQQVIVLMSPAPADRASTALVVQGSVRTRVEGRTLQIDGGSEGGVIDWGGARVRLSKDQGATVDALAGPAFPDYRPSSGKAPGETETPRRAAPGAN